jgi:putative transposase
MNTHFHLVVQAPCHKILSQNISYLKWHYTLWSRKKYGWKGPLWRERYKSLPIEDENYLYACGMYIEHNPVRAGICPNPADYNYSSYRKYHLGTCDSLVDDYAAGIDLSASLQLDYQSDLAKVIFSLSPAIGSRAFIKRSQNVSP